MKKYDDARIFALITQKLMGKISDEDDGLLQKAIEEDEQVRRCWEELHEANIATGHTLLEDIVPDEAWQTMDLESVALVEQEGPLRKASRRLQWWAAAALLVMAIGVFYWPRKTVNHPVATTVAVIKPAASVNINDIRLKLASGEMISLDGKYNNQLENGDVQLQHDTKQLQFTLAEHTSSTALQSLNTLTIPPGKSYTVLLSDGSKVQLNADSRLHFPFAFSGNNREVYLEGEAYFTVAKNASQPFIVHARGTAIRVLGTEFNVNSYDADKIVTSLVKGAVITHTDKKDVPLKPGFASVSQNNGEVEVKHFDEEAATSWTEGHYVLHETALADIAPLIERWFNMKVIFYSPDVKDIKVSAVLDRDSLKLINFLEAANKEKGINYLVMDSKVYLIKPH